MTWLYDQQFKAMVASWRERNPGQIPDAAVLDTLPVQARMIVDDVQRSQYLEQMEHLYPTRD